MFRTAHGQFASTPQLGISAFTDYQHSDVDSVNLQSGNVSVHIPLLSYPQLGDKLKLNFIARFNAPQWQVSATNVYTNWQTGVPVYFGLWSIASNFAYPIGVDVVRDQGITVGNIPLQFMCVASDGTGPADCGSGQPVWTSTTSPLVGYTQVNMTNLRDRTGAAHTISMNGGDAPSNTNPALAPDGSGWAPVQTGGTPTVIKDRDGITYTTKTIASSSGSVLASAHDLTDPSGNTITTNSQGWIDSLGRVIPGTYSGPGAYGNAGYPAEDDPLPGVPSTDVSKCSTGASVSRIWTIPWTNGTTATYTLCYSPVNASTHFNTTVIDGYQATISEGQFSVPLLTQVVLPNQTSYTFTYDNYLDLASITLPTGGQISYTWTTIPWDGASLSQPVTRAVSQRTETSATGVSSTWGYSWKVSTEGIVGSVEGTPSVSPGNVDVQVDVSKPDGNDEDHLTYSVASGGSNKVVYYQGKSPLDPNYTTSNPGKILRTEVTQYQILTLPFFEPLPQFPAQSNGDSPAAGVYFAPWSFQEQTLGPPLSKTVTLDNGSVSQTVYTPVPSVTTSYTNFGLNDQFNNAVAKASGTCQCMSYGETSSVAQYDYGAAGSGSPGPLLKTTTTTYQWNSGVSNAASYLAANLLDLPYSTVVNGPTGAWAAETDYAYDQSPSPSGALGNLTSVTRVNREGASPISQTQYNAQGMAVLKIDPKNNKTYVSQFQCGGLFPQMVIAPYQSTTTLPETTQYSYDCTLGKLNSVTDPNGNTATYTYADPLARVTDVKYPDGGHIHVVYNDTPLSVSVTETTTTTANNATPPIINTIIYDGLRRTTQTQLTSDPISTIFQDTSYDPLGRVHSKSNPYRTPPAPGDPPAGVTVYTYDALARKILQKQPDGSYLQWCYDGIPISPALAQQPVCTANQSSVANATWVDSADEKGQHWQHVSDGLGRLVAAMEPDPVTNALALETDYSYDALSNLWKVNQKGSSGSTARTRSFTYDSLSRLLCSSNPENSSAACPQSASAAIPSGVVSYGYDANGNLQSKTDARVITVGYTYDALNRVLSKTYTNDPSGTASSCYQYDQSSLVTSGGNLVGRLTNAWSQKGSCPSQPVLNSSATLTRRSMLSYDAMGRLLTEQQCTDANCKTGAPYNPTYDYDLAGNLVHHTNGIPTVPANGLQTLTFTNCYNGAGQLSLVVNANITCSTNPSYPPVAQMFSSPTYNPAGGLSGATYGVGLNLTRTYDSRLRITGETDTGNSATNPTPGTAKITITGTDQIH